MFTKQPSEQATLAFNWQSVLDEKGTGVTISSGTVASVNLADGTRSSGTFLSSTTATVSGANTTCRVINGTDGQNHKCTVTATFSDADGLQADLIVEVRDL